MKKIIEQLYAKVEVPLDYRIKLLDRLVSVRGDVAIAQGEALRRRPGRWVLLAAIIILALIIYGLWLPTTITL